MVVIDTSVWIEYFKGNEPYYKGVQELINSRSAYTIEPIFGELLQGALNERERKYIMVFWENISKIEDPNLFINAGELAYRKKLVSKGIKLIDASIIYTVLNNGFKLWTLDKKILNFLDEEYLFLDI